MSQSRSEMKSRVKVYA